MIIRLFTLCLTLLCLVGCEKSAQKEERKPLVVIISPDNPPFEFKETAHDGDQVVGFDVDVVQELSKRLGRPLKIVEADFAALIPSLQSGRADMAISELGPTDERRKSVDFSDTYYVNKSSLLVLEDSPLTSEKDLNGQKLGVQLGSTNETFARTWSQTIPNLSIISLNKVGDLVQELKNGRVQAILIGDQVARKIANSTPGVKVITADTPGGELAIAFPKGSPLVAPINAALKGMKEEISHIAEKWLSQ